MGSRSNESEPCLTTPIVLELGHMREKAAQRPGAPAHCGPRALPHQTAQSIIQFIGARAGRQMAASSKELETRSETSSKGWDLVSFERMRRLSELAASAVLALALAAKSVRADQEFCGSLPNPEDRRVCHLTWPLCD